MGSERAIYIAWPSDCADGGQRAGAPSANVQRRLMLHALSIALTPIKSTTKLPDEDGSQSEEDATERSGRRREPYRSSAGCWQQRQVLAADC